MQGPDRVETLYLLKNNRREEFNDLRRNHPDWEPNLSGVRLDADLREVNLAGADIRRTDLSQAKLFDDMLATCYADDLLHRTNLVGALYDVFTKFPPNVNPRDTGAVYVPQARRRSKAVARARVFMGYTWADKAFVTRVDEWLKLNGIETRRDTHAFVPGERLRSAILRVMTECNVILIFHSLKSFGRPWTTFERELAEDLEMVALQESRTPPRRIYILLDDVGLPNPIEANRLAIVVKGKTFEQICEEILAGILERPVYSE